MLLVADNTDASMAWVHATVKAGNISVARCIRTHESLAATPKRGGHKQRLQPERKAW